MRGFIIAITLAALLATAYADHHEHNYVLKTQEDLVKYRNHCVEKEQVPAELLEKIKKWDFPNEEKSRCYLKCVFEQFGLFDEKNGFDVYKIHHQLAGVDAVHPGHVDHDDETHKKIENCADKNTQGSDACTWAYRGATCFMRQNLNLVKQSLNP